MSLLNFKYKAFIQSWNLVEVTGPDSLDVYESKDSTMCVLTDQE